MKLVVIAAVIAVCGAAKLDRTYLPPASAATAGGSADSLQTPLTRSSSGQGEPTAELPTGSYTNNFQGVVVDAAAPGTRASPDAVQSGLGASRETYGSTNSKVGDAAFRGSVAGFRNTPSFGSSGLNGQDSGSNAAQNFGFGASTERPQASKDRNSNIVAYANDVSINNYSYGFEADNGIAVGENGVANNGIQAQGGYSYKGDDGQVYKVTYTADEGGYRPQGEHLPTPPPIPKEILESLEQNAKEEAAGLVDDGSYDAQKYNAEGDYTHHYGGNIQYNGAQLSQPTKRPESDAAASGTFINQNSQSFGKPIEGHLGSFGSQSVQSNSNGQANGFVSAVNANNQNDHGFDLKPTSQSSSGTYGTSTGVHNSENLGSHSGNQHTGSVGQIQHGFGTQNHHFGHQNNQQTPPNQFGTQSSHFGSHANQQSSASQLAPQPIQNNGQVFGSKPNHIGLASQFGAQPARPAFGQTFLGSISNQYSGQTYKPQGVGATNNYNQAANIVPFGQNQGLPHTSSASAFASVSQGGVGAQPSRPANNFQTQTPSHTNQLHYNTNNQITTHGQTASNTIPSSQHSGSHTAPSSSLTFGSKPTSIPDTELTTPLESNERPGLSQASQFGAESQPQNSQPQSSIGQPQIESNNNGDSLAHANPTLSPSFPTVRPQGQSHFEAPINNIAASPSTQAKEPSKGKPQFTHNSFAQNQQNNGYYSTQKPSFSQGPDYSYYYNQPAKPFGTPVSRPQGTRFPSSPSYQSNNVAGNQVSNQQSAIASAAPTSPSQLAHNHISPSSNNYYNGITQASISPFPSPSPTTTSTQHDTTQNGQFGSNSDLNEPSTGEVAQPNKPIISQQNPTAQPLPVKPTTGFEQNPSNSLMQNQGQFGQSPTTTLQETSELDNQDTQTPSTLTQQYEGTIYEYNKPPETLPAPDNSDTALSQSEQTDSSKSPSSETQVPEQIDTQTSKPQVESQNTQFGQNVFSAQSQPSSINQNNKPQFGAQPFKPFNNPFSINTQLGQNSRPNYGQTTFQQNTQSIQNNIESVKPQFGQNLPAFGSQTGVTSAHVPGNQFSHNAPHSHPSFPSIQPTHGYPSAIKPFKPFGSQHSTSHYGQHIQTGFGNQNQQLSGSQPGQNIQNDIGTQTQPAVGSQNGQNVVGSQSQQTSGTHFGHNTQHAFGSQSQHTTGSQYNQNNFGTQNKPATGSQISQVAQNAFDGQTQQTAVSQTGQNTGLAGQTSQQAESGYYYGPNKPTNQGSQALPQLGQNTPAFGQNLHQTTGSHFGTQPFKPFGAAITTSQFGHSHGSPISNVPSTQNNAQGSQYGAQSYKPFGSTASTLGTQSYKPFGTFGSIPTTQPNKPFGTSTNQNAHPYKPFGTISSQGSQGFPTKPFDAQKPQTQYTQNGQSFGSTQSGSQPAPGIETGALPSVNEPAIHGSPESQKPQYGQSPLNQGKPTGTFGQFQGTQFGSSINKPQYGSQVQGSQAYKPFGTGFPSQKLDKIESSNVNTASQTQVGVKPFGSGVDQGKPHFDQTATPSGTEAQKPDSTQDQKPESDKQEACCGSKDSSFGAVNVGKPSQAFGQTQSQFGSFQGSPFSAQTLAGKGEAFGGPRQPAKFDAQTGYYY